MGSELGYMVLALLVAIGFVLAPWLMNRVFHRGRGVDPEAEIDRVNVAKAHYELRVEEFTQDGAQVADTAIVEEIVDELGAALVREVSHDEGEAIDPKKQKNRPVGAVLASAVLVLAGAVLLYLWLGEPGLKSVRGAEVVLSLDAQAAQAELSDWQERLTERVNAAPDDHKSRYLLAHAELKLGNFKAAELHFAATNELTPGDVTVQVYWLQSQYLADRGVLDEQSLTLTREILNANPNMPIVLEILALDAVRQSDSQAAVKFLHRALTGSQNLMQQTNFVAAISALRKGFTNPGISVAVSAKIAPPQNSTVFVVARPVGGGMPYAVVRFPTHLLPQTVRLDDLVTMSDGVKLSDAESFEIRVRVSRSGTAIPEPDDWVWVSDPLSKTDLVLTGEAALLNAELTAP